MPICEECYEVYAVGEFCPECGCCADCCWCEELGEEDVEPGRGDPGFGGPEVERLRRRGWSGE